MGLRASRSFGLAWLRASRHYSQAAAAATPSSAAATLTSGAVSRPGRNSPVVHSGPTPTEADVAIVPVPDIESAC